MLRYDPFTAPDPDEWLALDEQERITLISVYHKKARIKLPNLQVHTVLHAIVENQIALGDEIPVARTLDRLVEDGLDRHDAIHAIAAALAEHLRSLKDRPATASDDPNATYFAALERLTPESWRASY